MPRSSLEDSVFRLFEKKLSQHTSFLPQEKIIVAVSGGIDSVVLYDLLSRLSEKIGFLIYVAHINHKMRGKASEEDSLFVKKLALSKGDLFFLKNLNPQKLKKSNFQAEARKSRYAFLNNLAKKHRIHKIFLAHQATDQIETFFINLLRASPPSSWAMDFISKKENVEWLRPLLFVEREDIQKYAKLRQLDWVEDCTNQQEHYLRNYIRIRVLPSFRKVHPQVIPNIIESLDQLKNSEHAMTFLLEATLQNSVQFQKNQISIPRELLSTYPRFLRTKLYYSILKRILMNPSKIKHEHLDFIDKMHTSNSKKAAVSLPEGWGGTLTQRSLLFKRWRVKNLKKQGFFVAP